MTLTARSAALGLDADAEADGRPVALAERRQDALADADARRAVRRGRRSCKRDRAGGRRRYRRTAPASVASG